MAKSTGLGDQFYYQGYDLSGDLSALKGIRGGPNLLDMTSIDKSAHERLGGIKSGSLGFTSFFNASAGQEHAILSTLPTTDVIMNYFRGTTLGNAAAGLVAKQVDYQVNRGQDGHLTVDVNAQSNGYPMEWGLMHTAGKVSHAAATNVTGIDGGTQGIAIAITGISVANPSIITAANHGLVTGDSVLIGSDVSTTPQIAAENYTVTVINSSTFSIPVNVTATSDVTGTFLKTSTNFGAAAYFQLFTITSNQIIPLFQDSADDVTYATITGLTFTTQTVARKAERLATASTAIIRRYTRFASTSTFTTATMAAMLARFTTATI